MTGLDPRLHAFRADLADERLRGQVEAPHFVKGQARQITWPVAAVLKAPRPDSAQLTQALLGETCLLFDEKDGFAFIQLDGDGYVGYVASDALGAVGPAATHWVSVAASHIYPQANIKTQPALAVPMLALVHVTHHDGDFAALLGGGFIHAKHVQPLGTWQKNFVSVAEQFEGTPYYWGGKTYAGLDCSGLVQVARLACGLACLRDTDMQEGAAAKSVVKPNALQRGDLVYWPGHVGIMQSATRILHANGFHMQVTSEALSKVIARSDTPIRAVKRLGIASK